MKLPFHRLHGKLTLLKSPAPASAIHCRVILNDLSEEGVGLFSDHVLRPGQEIELALEFPQGMICYKARVVWCREDRGSGRIVSASKYIFRVGLRFAFSSAEEQSKLGEIVQSLRRDPDLSLLPGGGTVIDGAAMSPDAQASAEAALEASQKAEPATENPAAPAEAPAAPQAEEPKSS